MDVARLAATPIMTTTAHPLVEMGSLSLAKLVTRLFRLVNQAHAQPLVTTITAVRPTPYNRAAPAMPNAKALLSLNALITTAVAHLAATPIMTTTAHLPVAMAWLKLVSYVTRAYPLVKRGLVPPVAMTEILALPISSKAKDVPPIVELRLSLLVSTMTAVAHLVAIPTMITIVRLAAVMAWLSLGRPATQRSLLASQEPVPRAVMMRLLVRPIRCNRAAPAMQNV